MYEVEWLNTVAGADASTVIVVVEVAVSEAAPEAMS